MATNASSTSCYTISHNTVYLYNQLLPCGPSSGSRSTAQACCHAGDICLQDGICYLTQSGVVNATGYYMAGCTDPTWKDPACPAQCSDEFQGDIIYNRGEGYWNCCEVSQDSTDCQNPTDFIVSAPSPGDLSTATSLATTVPSSTIVSEYGTVTISHSTAAGNAAATTNAPSQPTFATGGVAMPAAATESSLSTGAKVGIAVGVIGGIALVFGGGYLFYRRSRRRHEAFKNFNDADSQYSRRNTSHHTLSLHSAATTGRQSSRRDTYATDVTATTAATGYDTNRHTMTTTRSTAYNTNRNTYASSYYGEPPESPAPPLPEGADGIQVVKQLPQTPDEAFFAHNREKMLAEEKAQAGPFEMHSGGIEMQDRRPMSMQELEGTMPARAELEARSARSSVASGALSPSVRRMQDEEFEEEGKGRDEDGRSTERLRPRDGGEGEGT